MPLIPSDDISKRTDLWMMEDGFDSSVKEEPKTQFFAREGTYKLVTHADYSRGSRTGYNNPISSNIPVKISFLKRQQNSSLSEKICFNHGRELFVYEFKGISKFPAGDSGSKPLYQRPYKSFSPTCHDFCPNANGAGDSCPLLVGFSGGQVQLLDPLRKDIDRVFNDEQAVDRSKVTCVAWVPGDNYQFVAAHTSGCIYVYSSRLPATHSTPPVFHNVTRGPGFAVHTCRSRGGGSGGGGANTGAGASSGRNPQQRWTVGASAINRLAFSPCGQRLAVVGQDGWLRVFDWHGQRMLGAARSYFGALTCVAWSPDGRYVAVGGEDDLVTVWSLPERRVAVRGRGHKSWLADVAFDPVMSTMPCGDATGLYAPEVNYRLGSVGQDTQLCLWDLSADLLRPPRHKHRTSLVPPLSSSSPSLAEPPDPPPPEATSTLSAVSARLWPLRLSNTSVRRQTAGAKLAPGPVNGGAADAGNRGSGEVVGTVSCPRLTDCPLVEPHLACAISAERLTALVFLTDCLLTGCADGYICTWTRPTLPPGGGGCPSVCANTNGTVV